MTDTTPSPTASERAERAIADRTHFVRGEHMVVSSVDSLLERITSEITAAELAARPQWLPIESAPVNESVLIYIPNAEHYGEGIYRGLLKQSVSGRLTWMATSLHMGRDLGGDDVRPTHWMPLPEPPSKETV